MAPCTLNPKPLHILQNVLNSFYNVEDPEPSTLKSKMGLEFRLPCLLILRHSLLTTSENATSEEYIGEEGFWGIFVAIGVVGDVAALVSGFKGLGPGV